MLMRILFFLIIISFIIICTKIIYYKKKTNYLILVNGKNKVPTNWHKTTNFVKTKSAWNKTIKIEKKTYEAYKKLKEELKQEGIIIELDTVYRTVHEQQKIWDDWKKEKGIDYVHKYVAKPGYSEHHTGLAIDICIIKNEKTIVEIEDMLKEREIYKKIHEIIPHYGFILRYPRHKEKITGYGYEPWHFRYINNKETAMEIMYSKITLEEYLKER